MRVVVALGGNALLRRGEPMTAENQRANVRRAAEALAPVAREHELVISHGNGPQVGLLALQAESGLDAAHFPLDVLGAQTEGMIGYLIEQELGNLMPFEKPFATLLTMVEVDLADPAFKSPNKPIGPVYSEEEARRLAKERGWAVAPDGAKWRRVVASPKPKRVFEIRPVKWLLEKGTIVICGGGGGIPTVYDENGKLLGVEAVIDKDRVASLLAQHLDADVFIMATDVAAVAVGWGTPSAKAIRRASPAAIGRFDFASGSMGPKVEAARDFAERTGKTAAIGALQDIPAILAGQAGTLVSNAVATIEWAPSEETLALFTE
jgi:carbamate kinase